MCAKVYFVQQEGISGCAGHTNSRRVSCYTLPYYNVGKYYRDATSESLQDYLHRLVARAFWHSPLSCSRKSARRRWIRITAENYCFKAHWDVSVNKGGWYTRLHQVVGLGITICSQYCLSMRHLDCGAFPFYIFFSIPCCVSVFGLTVLTPFSDIPQCAVCLSSVHQSFSVSVSVCQSVTQSVIIQSCKSMHSASISTIRILCSEQC